MIRKSTLSLKNSNISKLSILDKIFLESKRVINLYINELWEEKDFSSKFIDFKVDSWLSARLLQCLGKQALQIVKSQRKKKKKIKPVFTRDVIELDSRFVDFRSDENSFDFWVKLTCLGNKINLKLPARKHKHFNKFKNGEQKKSCRLRKVTGNYCLDVYFEKEENFKTKGDILGVDIGYKKLIVTSEKEIIGKDFEKLAEKISRKKVKSKAFYKALKERDNFICRCVNKLGLGEVKDLIVEDLKNVKKNTKKDRRIRTKFMNKLQRWTYSQVLFRLGNKCIVQGVNVVKVLPHYTSRTCSVCGEICKSNRKGEIYKCSCGVRMDADINAAINILHRGVYSLSAVLNKS